MKTPMKDIVKWLGFEIPEATWLAFETPLLEAVVRAVHAGIPKERLHEMIDINYAAHSKQHKG